METKRNEYETPRVEDHGDLAELTAGKNHGGFTDHEYPVGTPIEVVLQHLTTVAP